MSDFNLQNFWHIVRHSTEVQQLLFNENNSLLPFEKHEIQVDTIFQTFVRSRPVISLLSYISFLFFHLFIFWLSFFIPVFFCFFFLSLSFSFFFFSW